MGNNQFLLIMGYIHLSIFVVFITLIKMNGFLCGKIDLLLVPPVAFRDHSSSSNWIAYNQGWYYEENSLNVFLLEKSLELFALRDLDRNRTKIFSAGGKSNEMLCMKGLSRSICEKTDDDGRITNSFTLTNQEIESLRQPDDKILYEIVLSKTNLEKTSEIYLCDDNGMTVISDIDDTIKITEVTSSHQVIVNTFGREFKAVPGMSELYRYWKKTYNSTFAYLTASPIQLYSFLRDFFAREQFPMGSAHMRHFTWFDENFIKFFTSADYIQEKTDVLQMFLKSTLNRIFVLLGDIFQHDPEIYANIYAQYPDRIAKIFIRKYADDEDGQQRLEEVFKDIPKNKWATFETGDDIPRKLF